MQLLWIYKQTLDESFSRLFLGIYQDVDGVYSTRKRSSGK